jgi:hypothetical protein
MVVRQSGVFGGTIEADGERYTVGLEIVEEIDAVTGRVVETVRDINEPSRGSRHEIGDRRYQITRSYLIGQRIREQQAHAHRNRPVTPLFKQPPARRPKRIVTTDVCHDCNGSGWYDGHDCPACDGDGWVLRG